MWKGVGKSCLFQASSKILKSAISVYPRQSKRSNLKSLGFTQKMNVVRNHMTAMDTSEFPIHYLTDHSFKIPKSCDKFLLLNRIREAYPKVSQIEANLTEFWKSSSFPFEPEYFLDEDLCEERENLTNKLVCLLRSAIQEYPDDVKEVASSSPSPEPGKYFDVVELLSRFPGDLIRNNGDRVPLTSDTFKGKHVLICCFHVPVFKDESFQCFVNLCNELYSTRDDFEMVMVARMNRLADYPEVFHHLFSGFPKSCLAVPFEDKIRRDYICQLLDLSLDWHDIEKCVLINADGIVSHFRDKDFRYRSSNYGAVAFPFTNDVMNKIYEEERALTSEREGNWVERVLRCNDFSPDFVYKFNPEGGPREEVPISELAGDGYVGLYLCCWGGLFSDILTLCEQCKEKQLDFKVVVVYMPFSDCSDPKVFQENIDTTLLKKHNVRDWWCLPFNNSVSLRFSRIIMYYEVKPEDLYDDYSGCDKLIIVGPGVDDHSEYPLDVPRDIDAFPFSIDGFVRAGVNKFREITLESLFVDNEVSVFRGSDSSDSMKLGELLQGKKKIILCINSLDAKGRIDFETLASIYSRTKAVEKDGFEMVSVARPGLVVPSHEMPWYICPAVSLNSTKLKQLMSLVMKQAFNPDQYRNALMGFGEDGRREQAAKTDLDLRLEKLRQARGFAQASTSKSAPEPEPDLKPPEPALKPEREALWDQPREADSRHINLLEGIRFFDPVEIKANKVEEKEKQKKNGGNKRAKKVEPVRLVTAEDEKYKLGYGVAGKGVDLPWYMAKPEKKKQADDEDSEEEEEDYDCEVQFGKRKRNQQVVKKKSLQELREERLQREKKERERERALLGEKKKPRRSSGFSSGYMPDGYKLCRR